MAEGDFELALRGLLGDGAPLSKASIRRLRAGWTTEFEACSKRLLADREVVYVRVDGIYVKAGLGRDKASLLVVMGAMRDGTKEVLSVASGYRESTESWSRVFRDLKARGLGAPRLLMADGNAAIWGAARQVWPDEAEQRSVRSYDITVDDERFPMLRSAGTGSTESLGHYIVVDNFLAEVQERVGR